MKEMNEDKICFIPDDLLPWEKAFRAKGWTPESLTEAQQALELYHALNDQALRNSLLDEIYRMVQQHLQEEIEQA